MGDITLKSITLQGVPLGFTLRFPYHPSSAGSDWHVLHGTVTLEDGSGLFAEVAVQMSEAVRHNLPSLDVRDTLGVSVNSIRKMVDTKDVEFLKSTKRQPIHLNSRVFSIVQKRWTFQNATDDQLTEFLAAKVYWVHKTGIFKVLVNDSIDQLYLNATGERMMAAAKKLASQGMVSLEGENAVPTDALKALGPQLEAKTKRVLEELDAKHQFERETQKA